MKFSSHELITSAVSGFGGSDDAKLWHCSMASFNVSAAEITFDDDSV